MSVKKIKSALISVFYKDGLDDIVKTLSENNVKIYSTGGTYNFITDLGIKAEKVEDLTTYPSILGGRVKTLHPLVFGGILARRDNDTDLDQMKQYGIPEIDMVVVDLYPFEETVKNTTDNQAIIEKIDIGGISLIRAAAKNYKDVLIVSNRNQYAKVNAMLREKDCYTTETERRNFAAEAFMTSSGYDTQIFKYFNRTENISTFRESCDNVYPLRYGENPHQKGVFFGDPAEMFDKLHGKELSYNNLLDVDAAVGLIDEFSETTVAIIKHNNACGVASRETILQAWTDALACDPVSAFGGVIAANACIDETVAEEINKLFFEIILAPDYTEKALEILEQKKNRIILRRKNFDKVSYTFKSVLNGVLWQDRDNITEGKDDMKPVTPVAPTDKQLEDLIFANIIVKHSKSNSIVLAKNKQLCASGIGQTSRVDSLKQAIAKAKNFGFDLNGAVMSSDAYFPFSDCVEIAYKEGIMAVVQPGGSIRDKDSIDFCTANGMAMVFTGVRHFKH